MTYRPAFGKLLVEIIKEKTSKNAIVVDKPVQRGLVFEIPNEAWDNTNSVLQVKGKVVHFEEHDAKEIRLDKRVFYLVDQLDVLIIEE